MVKFFKAPKIKKYVGELEEVSFVFQIPVQKNPNSNLTGYEALSRMIRPVIKGLQEKPMVWNGFEYIGAKRKSIKTKK